MCTRKYSCSEFVKFWQYWSVALNNVMTLQKEVIWGKPWEMVGGDGRAYIRLPWTHKLASFFILKHIVSTETILMLLTGVSMISRICGNTLK